MLAPAEFPVIVLSASRSVTAAAAVGILNRLVARRNQQSWQSQGAQKQGCHAMRRSTACLQCGFETQVVRLRRRDVVGLLRHLGSRHQLELRNPFHGTRRSRLQASPRTKSRSRLERPVNSKRVLEISVASGRQNSNRAGEANRRTPASLLGRSGGQATRAAGKRHIVNCAIAVSRGFLRPRSTNVTRRR